MPGAEPTVALFYLADALYGGWPTYTAHLYRGLQDAGCKVGLYRIGAGTEKKNRAFGRGISYRNVGKVDAAKVARLVDVALVVVCDKQHQDRLPVLLDHGAAVVVHDPTECKGEMLEMLRTADARVVVNRVAMQHYMEGHGIHAEPMPHPYMRLVRVASSRVMHAVSFSRVDFDKNVSLIVEANRSLNGPATARVVWIYGAVNRIYAHHRLDRTDADWRRFYVKPGDKGDLWWGTRLAARATYAVDMSTIKHDGGGTQYTHLEALDGGARLVLNAGWMLGEGSEAAQYAHAVADADELVRVLTDPSAADWEKLRRGGAAVLAQHDATHVAQAYVDLLA